MEKVKVLMGVIGKGNGGMSTYAVRLFRLLDPGRFEVTFLSNAEHPFYEKDILEGGGKIVVIPSRNRHPIAYRRAVKAALSEGYDVCHAHLASASNIDLPLLALKAKVPMVIAHSHSGGFEGSKLAYYLHKFNQRKLRSLPVTRLACSKQAGEYLFGKVDCGYAPNAVDLERFSFRPEQRTALRERYGLDGCFTVGYLGRLVPIKNIPFLVEVFAELHAMTPKAKLLICGNGPEEAALRQKAEELGIADDVVFTGNVTDPENYLCAMDCFVLPSSEEGLGLVVIEALGTGMPCFISEAIPPEVEICRMVRRYRFADDKKEIAKMMLSGMGTPRRAPLKELEEAGFEAHAMAKMMEKRYLEGCGKEEAR